MYLADSNYHNATTMQIQFRLGQMHVHVRQSHIRANRHAHKINARYKHWLAEGSGVESRVERVAFSATLPCVD